MSTVAAVVLAAGGGRRYGMPKALVSYEGSLLVERAVRTAAAVCDPVLVVLGAQAVDVWRTADLTGATVLAALRMVPVVEAVSIPFFAQFLADDDEFTANAELEAGAKSMLDELLRLTAALKTLRTAA